MCYCDVSIDHYSFQTQTLEESESQDRIAAQDLPHQHVLVVYLENFYGDIKGVARTIGSGRRARRQTKMDKKSLTLWQLPASRGASTHCCAGAACRARTQVSPPTGVPFL